MNDGSDRSRAATSTAEGVDGLAKAIRDADVLVNALLSTVAQGKTWQRQLRFHLADADRAMQVLRLTIAMERAQAEMADASSELLCALRAAMKVMETSRADMQTRRAVRLGFALVQRVHDALAFRAH